MITFKEKVEAAPQWQRDRYIELVGSIPLNELSDAERCKLLALASNDQETVDAFKGIFERIGGNHE